MNAATLCLLAAALAGLASTLLELAWLRVASAALPGTLPAAALVVPAFLVAWAAGSALAGRRADRDRVALPACGRWLAAAAAGVLLAPRLLDLLAPAAGTAGPAARFLAAALPAAPAAFCLGGVLPRLSRLRRDAGLSATRASGGAAAALTAGAAFGAAVFVPVLASAPGPLVTAIAALLLAAALCRLLAAWERPRSPGAHGDPIARAGGPAAAGAAPAPAAALGLAVLVGGAVLVAGQLGMLRGLAQYHGDSIATSSEVLAAVHAGMALGSVLLCLLPGTVPAGSLVALLLIVGGGAALLPGWLLPARDDAPAAWLALACAAPLGLGAGSLVTAASRARGASGFGAWIGDLTFLSTLGGAGGGLLYVWVLSPSPGIGTGAALRWAAVAAALVALVVATTCCARRLRWACVGLALALLAAAFRAAPLDLPWRVRADDAGLLRRAEGPWGAVSLVATADGGRRLQIDHRFSQGGTEGSLLARRLGRLAASFAPDARRSLLLGLGMGHTLAGLAATTRSAVDCVEHNAQILALGLGVPFEPGSSPAGGLPRVIHADARAWLADHPRTYDLVVGDLVFPWMPGAGDLFSRETFLLMRAALTDGGVAVQWVPLHQVPWPAFGAAVNAFAEAFPDARLFVASPLAATPLVALVGGLVAGLPPADRVDALLAGSPSAAGPSGAVDVYDLFVADSWTLQSRFRDEPVDTLAAPWVELGSLRRQDDEAALACTNTRLLAELAVPLDTSSLQARPLDEKQNRRLGAELTARSAALAALLHARAALLELREAPAGSLAQVDRDALAADVTNALLVAWHAAPGHVGAADALLERANELTREERWEAAGGLLEAALDILPEPRLQGLLGGILLHERHVEPALAVLARAREQAPADRTVLMNLGSALLIAGGHDDEARQVLAEARELFPVGGMPPLQGAALSLLEGDAGAAPIARLLLEKLPGTEPWAVVLRRLLESAPAASR